MASFRQIDQKHISAEVSKLEWNPALDLIAMGTSGGDVLLHRLSWQKVWSVPPAGTKDTTVLVTALAWRPDGKILAYAYDNGKVTLCDVENADKVHLIDVHCAVTSLNWVPCTDPPGGPDQKPFYVDHSEDFLDKHYSAGKAYTATSKQSEEAADGFKNIKDQKEFHILAVGLESGILHLYAYGMFPFGHVDVNIEPEGKVKSKVISVTLSADFEILVVGLERKEEDGSYSYFYRSFNMELLSKRMEEIKVVSLKYGQISSLLTYLSATIRAISEAWEDILMEVDLKLHNYGLQKEQNAEESSISDDFLELLVFGNPSDSLEKFLMHDLTESGLKKFGHSIEMSYSNIQKLVLKRLQSVATSLYYHVTEFKGMSQWTRRFADLGLDEAIIHEAVMSVGSFLLKATELQQVIDNSMKNFKSFFRWLYGVILRLSDEPVPCEVSKYNQQDLAFVSEFLKDNFIDKCDADGKKYMVKLEKVAQYLKKEELQYPVVTSGNPWVKFLEENPCIYDTGMVFPPHPKKSLVTMFTEMRQKVDAAMKGTWQIMHKSVTSRSTLLLHHSIGPAIPVVSSISSPASNCIYTVVTDQIAPCNHFYILREKTKVDNSMVEGVRVKFRSDALPENNFKILDVQFYNKETLSVLLLEDIEAGCPVLFQLPLQHFLNDLRPITQGPIAACANLHAVGASCFMDATNQKRLDGVRGLNMAVSGTRKVVCVLFASKRQVRLFEMEVEDEEDLDESSRMEDSSRMDESSRIDESSHMDEEV